MVKKSKDAYRNIREVSDLLHLEPHVLRFWESKFETLQPMTLGGGRRFYAPEDIELIKTIQELLHGQGLTIKAASRLIAKHGNEAPLFAIANDLPKKPLPETAKPAKSGATGHQIDNEKLEALVQIDALLLALENRAKSAIARCDEMLENIALAAR